eukprot:342245-Amphidinium_carterae.1
MACEKCRNWSTQHTMVQPSHQQKETTPSQGHELVLLPEVDSSGIRLAAMCKEGSEAKDGFRS